MSNYSISLAYEHCVVTVSVYDCPVPQEDEDQLTEIAISAIESDFPTVPRHFHDVTIEENP